MNQVKRERSTNFTIQERDALVDLVQKYKEVLENKESDGTSWKRKESAWECIERDFNAHCGGIFRSKKTLKIKYEGLKRSVRKKSAAIRSELYRTGGGPSRAPPLDAVEQRIKAMITLSTDGLESVCDSDFVPQTHSQNELNNVPMEGIIFFPSLEECVEIDISNSKAITPQDSEPTVSQAEPDIPDIENVLDRSVEERKDIISGPATTSKIWNVTSRRSLKSKKKHPSLATPTATLDALSEAKLNLVKLQTTFLLEEMDQKREEWHYQAQFNKLKLEEQEYRLKQLKENITTNKM